jgi:hypothetical protein
MYISSDTFTGKVAKLPNGDYVADASDLGLKPTNFPLVVRIGAEGAFRFEKHHMNEDDEIVKTEYKNSYDVKLFILND